MRRQVTMEAQFLYHNNWELKQRRQRRQRQQQKSSRFILAKQQLYTLVHFLAVVRLLPSRYLSVFWGERRLGMRLRRARGLMGREEGEIATIQSSLTPKKHLISDWV